MHHLCGILVVFYHVMMHFSRFLIKMIYIKCDITQWSDPPPPYLTLYHSLGQPPPFGGVIRFLNAPLGKNHRVVHVEVAYDPGE